MAPPSEKRTPFLGLTGAVAAGKTSVLEALERRGARTLSSDAIVHELLATERVRDLLSARWGPEVVPDGQIDRGRVGSIVFNDPAELAWLEEVLHPLVGERIAAWRDEVPTGARLAIVEVPLLFETGMDATFDATIAVVAPDEARVERAGARGTSELERRSARQLPQTEKAERATFVIENDGTLSELEQRIDELVARLAPADEGGA